MQCKYFNLSCSSFITILGYAIGKTAGEPILTEELDFIVCMHFKSSSLFAELVVSQDVKDKTCGSCNLVLAFNLWLSNL
jgi:hypothetical protein